MKSTVCFILIFTLTLNLVSSKHPQQKKQPGINSFNAKKSYQQPSVATNINHKNSISSSSTTGEKESQILRNNVEVKGDGTYQYDFETSNGIKRSEKGAVDGSIQGFSSYISPEGIEIKTSYVADETGYHPVGDHIPKIPDYIVRALEYIRDHPYIEKDYYTGEIKQTSASTKKPLKTTTITTKRSAYSNNQHKIIGSAGNKKPLKTTTTKRSANSKNQQRTISHGAKNNFRH